MAPGNEFRTVFISNLSYNVDEEKLKSFFSKVSDTCLVDSNSVKDLNALFFVCKWLVNGTNVHIITKHNN